MRLLQNRSFLKVATIFAGIGFLPSAFLALAARSDFVWRGCGEIAPSSWPSTANCSDAYSVAWALGSIAVVFFLVGVGAIWRLWYV